MLSRIEIENIGPADELGISPGPGTTLLTGENGRGRTLILDAAWRALTGVWPSETNHSLGTGYRSVPMQHAKGAQINAVLTDQQGKEETFRAHYPAGKAEWRGPQHRGRRSLVYAHGNDAISAWIGGTREGRARHALSLRPDEVFGDDPRSPHEAARWYNMAHTLAEWRLNREASGAIDEAIRACIPEREREGLNTGELARSVRHGRLRGGALQRMMALAFVVVWTWLNTAPAYQEHGMTVLIDDIESHLHPQWQRTMMGRMRDLARNPLWTGRLQLIVTTNAPLVLASVEPWFDADNDRLIGLEARSDGRTEGTEVREHVFTRHGRVGNWLTSEIFGFATDRNLVAEQAILDAKQIALEKEPDSTRVRDVDRALRAALPDDDEFWVRWRYFAEQQLGRDFDRGENRKNAQKRGEPGRPETEQDDGTD